MNNIYKGRLKHWNEDKGFGFICSENVTRDIFIHISALKNMSRRPIVGDIISYQIHTDNKGKNRAVNAKIEGVSTIKPQIKRKSVTIIKHSSNPFPKLFFLGLLIFTSILFYNNYLKKKNSLVVNNFTVISDPKPVTSTPKPVTSTPKPVIFTPKPVKHHFKCDGRKYCSQMKSRAEAVFFINNCPNTKMDGDRDGRPCENDSRF